MSDGRMGGGRGGWRVRLPPFLGSRTRRAAWQRTKARRVLSATLAGLAVWLLGAQLVPHPVEVGVPVVVVARALPIGTMVTGSDLRIELRPPSERPDGALTTAAETVGRISAGPLTVGEVLTSGRFAGAGLLAGLLPSVRPADSVQVLVPGSGQILSAGARVLGVDAPDTGLLGGGTERAGRLVVALKADEARAVAASMATATGASGFVVALLP